MVRKPAVRCASGGDLSDHVQEKKRGVEKRLLHGALAVEATPPSDPNDLSTCDVTITPACIAALYVSIHIPSPILRPHVCVILGTISPVAPPKLREIV